MPVVTLLTDFGTADYFVAAMKGVILSRCPAAVLVDVTHEVPPQDVRAGAFTLLATYREFPAGTVHLAVVDPGVGSDRRPVVASAGGHLFVGPDNGLLGYVLAREPGARVHHLTRDALFRKPLSTTFHGRDVFAPAAAALAAGARPEELGPEVADFVRMDLARPRRTGDGALEGVMLHVDRFGNCVTSFTREEVPEGRGVRVTVRGREIRSIRRYFAEEGAKAGEPFGIWGSAGFLELAVYRGSAAGLLGAAAGEPVTLRVE